LCLTLQILEQGRSQRQPEIDERDRQIEERNRQVEERNRQVEERNRQIAEVCIFCRSGFLQLMVVSFLNFSW
jgi:uncharacterized protein (DUF3084 family)